MRRLRESSGDRNRAEESLPRRRRRAKLRGQRQNPQGRAFRARSGSSRRPATPAVRSAPHWRRYHIHLDGPRVMSNGPDAHAGQLSRPGLRKWRDRERADGGGREVPPSRRRLGDRTIPPRRWPTARRSAGSRAEWNSGRARSARAPSSAIARSPSMQKLLNLKVKYRESLPALRTGGAARGCRRLVRARLRQPLHAAGRRREAERRRAMTAAEAGPVRHRQAQRAHAPRFRP